MKLALKKRNFSFVERKRQAGLQLKIGPSCICQPTLHGKQEFTNDEYWYPIMNGLGPGI
jgi:fructose-specific component phosphotransferase system IIB-like protein